MPEAAPTITKQYTELAKVQGAQITKCSTVLENHMQCWRAGDYQVTITTTTPPTTKDGEATVKVQGYQLCRAHAILESQDDARNPAITVLPPGNSAEASTK